jgi:hypothetical protein
MPPKEWLRGFLGSYSEDRQLFLNCNLACQNLPIWVFGSVSKWVEIWKHPLGTCIDAYVNLMTDKGGISNWTQFQKRLTRTREDEGAIERWSPILRISGLLKEYCFQLLGCDAQLWSKSFYTVLGSIFLFGFGL